MKIFANIRSISRMKALIVAAMVVFAIPAACVIARESGKEIVVVKSIEDFGGLLRQKELVAVFAVGFDGKQYLLKPDYVRTEPAKFPEAAKEIYEPFTVTFVPYSVNPNCALLRGGDLQAWYKYCR